MRLLVVLAVVGCHDDPSAPPPPPAPVHVPIAMLPPAEVSDAPPPIHADWSNMVIATPSCWYFSGPEGRDTKLTGPLTFQRDGEKLTLAWDNAVFTGSLKDGVVDLSRVTTHDFENPWSVTETLKGTYREGSLRAHYTYTECESGTKCPNQCRIDADLLIARTH